MRLDNQDEMWYNCGVGDWRVFFDMLLPWTKSVLEYIKKTKPRQIRCVVCGRRFWLYGLDYGDFTCSSKCQNKWLNIDHIDAIPF